MLEDASIELMLYTIAMVVIFAFLMNLILYKPLLGFMEKREKIILDDEEYAKNALDNIGEYDGEIKAILDNAKNEANAIRQELMAKYKSKYDEAMALEKDKLEKDYNEFLSKLELGKKELEDKLMLELETYRECFKASVNKI